MPPIHNIQTKEYECTWCGYKWINRFNGKDGPILNYCAKCKRSNWNGGWAEAAAKAISPKERGLRRRIKDLPNFYYTMSRSYSDRILWVGWSLDICKQFLSIEPRPTIEEMYQVLTVMDTDLKEKGREGWMPDPDRPSWLKRDPKGDCDLLKQQAQRRIEIMTQIIRSRGVDYDRAPILKEAMDHYLQEEEGKPQQKIEVIAFRRMPEWQERQQQTEAEAERWWKSRREETHKKRSERVKQWWDSRR
jgi:hypothetical protein